MKLLDRVAIVTGGSRGIGYATALQLAREGANIVVVGRDFDQAAKVAKEVETMGRRALPISTDVAKSNEVNRMAKATLDEFGKIDILVNCAGGVEKLVLFSESTEDVWDRVIARNLKGVLNCCRAVINPMIERRYGRIISVTSIAGVSGLAKHADYSAAKAGVIGFSKALAKEVGEYGITVNCVSPSSTETERIRKLITDEERRIQSKMTLVGRLGRPEDTASMVVFLANEEANFITGQNYLVCGGRSLGYK